jgi:ABC-type sugar transport system ATPase subunit
VTLARALARPWRLLILDEATSALDVGSRDALFRHLRINRPSDSAILFISHRMDEIASLADSVTVLQSGKTSATLSIGDAHPERLISMISSSRDGELIAEARSPNTRETETGAEPRLRARALVLRSGAKPIDFQIQPGEILGLSGLDGHGQADFLATLGGLKKGVSGHAESSQDGAWVEIASLRDAVRRGVCYVPRDRKSEGLFLGLPVFDNYGLPTLMRDARFSFVNRRAVRNRAERDLATMHTRYAGLSAPVGQLSGGNQQKVLLARWLAVGPAVMLLDDPLRGVDAATKGEIYDVFRTLAGRGVSILLLSTEIEELLTVCHRVAVFRDAELRATLAGSGLTREAIVSAMFGRSQNPTNSAER